MLDQRWHHPFFSPRVLWISQWLLGIILHYLLRKSFGSVWRYFCFLQLKGWYWTQLIRANDTVEHQHCNDLYNICDIPHSKESSVSKCQFLLWLQNPSIIMYLLRALFFDSLWCCQLIWGESNLIFWKLDGNQWNNATSRNENILLDCVFPIQTCVWWNLCMSMLIFNLHNPIR